MDLKVNQHIRQFKHKEGKQIFSGTIKEISGKIITLDEVVPKIEDLRGIKPTRKQISVDKLLIL